MEITATIGTKVEDDAAAKLDMNKVGLTVPRPNQPPVEGQYWSQRWTICPWCGAGGWSEVSTEVWQAVRCWSCGRLYDV